MIIPYEKIWRRGNRGRPSSLLEQDVRAAAADRSAGWAFVACPYSFVKCETVSLIVFGRCASTFRKCGGPDLNVQATRTGDMFRKLALLRVNPMLADESIGEPDSESG